MSSFQEYLVYKSVRDANVQAILKASDDVIIVRSLYFGNSPKLYVNPLSASPPK